MEMDRATQAALRHYEAMKKAQKKYYEKKMDAKGPRRTRGRPAKSKEEGVAEGSIEDASKSV